MAANDGRFLDDAASLRGLISQMPFKERTAYEQLRALNLESAFPNRRMVLYTLDGTAPVGVSLLLFGDMEMTRIGGPTITVSDDLGPVVIDVHPKRWRDRDVFLHVPQTFILKWKGKDAGAGGLQYVPHYAVLIKTRSKEHHQVDGDTYCVTLNTFRERFPEYPIRY